MQGTISSTSNCEAPETPGIPALVLPVEHVTSVDLNPTATKIRYPWQGEWPGDGKDSAPCPGNITSVLRSYAEVVTAKVHR